MNDNEHGYANGTDRSAIRVWAKRRPIDALCVVALKSNTARFFDGAVSLHTPPTAATRYDQANESTLFIVLSEPA